MSHGDLHARHILIEEETDRAVLVDTGHRSDRHHWARDLARLCVALWVSAWDSRNQHFWKPLSDWRDQVHRWHAGVKVVAPNAVDARVLEALLGRTGCA